MTNKNKSKRKEKKNLRRPVTIIVVFIFIILTSIFCWQKLRPLPPSPPPEYKASETTNWRTFIYKGLSTKYPPSWAVRPEGGRSAVFSPEKVAPSYSIMISHYDKFDIHVRSNEAANAPGNSILEKPKDITISNQPAVNQYFKDDSGLYSMEVYVINNDTGYVIRSYSKDKTLVESNRSIFLGFLSSIKFL